MKTYPSNYIERNEINLRHGIKSSLGEIKELFALVYALYLSDNKNSSLAYSKEVNLPDTQLEIQDSLLANLKSLFGALVVDDSNFENAINNNPLFKSQIESLQVTLELFWKLAKIAFINNPGENTRERTGGKRFNKKIDFSTNIILLDHSLSERDNSVSSELRELLYNWIMKTPSYVPDVNLYKKITTILTIFSEETQFKIRKEDGSELYFQQEGIYEELLKGNTVTDKDNVEPVGPFRILKSFVKSGLHRFIKEDGNNGFNVKNQNDLSELQNYNKSVETSLNLIPKRTVIYQTEENIIKVENSDHIQSSENTFSQIIFYGSPGTGKSHKADDITKGKEVKKVTFHPDYDYHSFVGGYKPTMEGDKIAYKFVPQIFTKIYVDAWKNFESDGETNPFYLQIEEINRGNCAEIFGDLFQLLDRKADGSSKYEVTAEEELKKYLEGEDGFGTAEHEGIKEGKLRLPSNLKIIATMNTSDQSLFPMDSAFKRRWDWIYIPIDYDCLSSDFTIQLDNGKAFKWLEFLRNVNKEIYEITKTQDKQLGNWFINAQNTGKIISESTFINKVLFYLWNDVFKDEENTIFKSADGDNLTYTSFFEKTDLVSYILEERLKLTNITKAQEITAEEE